MGSGSSYPNGNMGSSTTPPSTGSSTSGGTSTAP
jgi:hypothetical protein